MMRRAALFAAPALLSLLAALLPASAQAQVTLGRLFSTPAERATMEASRGAAAALAPNSQDQQPVPGTPGGPATGGGQPQSPVAADPPMPGNAATPETPPPPSTLVMSGVLRRSDNRTTVWLNDEPHYGAQKSTAQRPGAATPAVTVTLPSGRKIILKAGQRYDLTDGRIKDINEP